MSGPVKVTTEVSLRRWQAPNFAVVEQPPARWQDGFVPIPGTPVAKLSPEALDALASAWLEDLYAKVNRPVPFASTKPREGK